MVHEHDPIITVDQDNNYVKTTCRACSIQLDDPIPRARDEKGHFIKQDVEAPDASQDILPTDSLTPDQQGVAKALDTDELNLVVDPTVRHDDLTPVVDPMLKRDEVPAKTPAEKAAGTQVSHAPDEKSTEPLNEVAPVAPVYHEPEPATEAAPQSHGDQQTTSADVTPQVKQPWYRR